MDGIALWNELATTSTGFTGFERQKKVSIESCQTEITVRVKKKHLINCINSFHYLIHETDLRS